LSSSLNAMSIVDKHCNKVCCDEFLVPQTVAQKILFAIRMVLNTRYLRHFKYKNLWINNKAIRGKNANSLHFSISAKYLQKIRLFNFQR